MVEVLTAKGERVGRIWATAVIDRIASPVNAWQRPWTFWRERSCELADGRRSPSGPHFGRSRTFSGLFKLH
jgi:hypothetical protein